MDEHIDSMVETIQSQSDRIRDLEAENERLKKSLKEQEKLSGGE